MYKYTFALKIAKKSLKKAQIYKKKRPFFEQKNKIKHTRLKKQRFLNHVEPFRYQNQKLKQI